MQVEVTGEIASILSVKNCNELKTHCGRWDLRQPDTMNESCVSPPISPSLVGEAPTPALRPGNAPTFWRRIAFCPVQSMFSIQASTLGGPKGFPVEIQKADKC